MKIENIKSILIEKQIDALIIKSKANKQYIEALTGSGVYILLTKNKNYQILDGRYIDEANKKTSGFENIVVLQGNYIPTIITLLKQLNITNIGIENQDMTIQEYICLKDENFNIFILTNELSKIRGIKTKQEIDLIKKACEITDEVFKILISKIKEGMTELEVSALIQYYSLKYGATNMAFEPIVASGIRGAMPHGRPTSKKLVKNEAITIDFGVVYQGYQSDMTRTISIGKPPDIIQEIYNIVLNAQLEAIKNIKAGAKACDIDKIARDFITKNGYGQFFTHGLGHGMGIGGGEIPTLNFKSTDILKEGMVMSCEPGIYIQNVGGVRIEDNIAIINAKGVSLNKTTKEFIMLGE